MKDFTQGSIPRHLIGMSLPLLVSMLVNAVYLLVDTWFVAQLGPVAVAAVGASTTLFLLQAALAQMLHVGTVSMIARATGAGEHQRANRVFIQGMWLGLALAVSTLLLGFPLIDWYLQRVSTDVAVHQAGREFLVWYLPTLSLGFLVTAISAALRAVGVVKPVVAIQMISVLVNIALAPVLIFGVGTGVAFGVSGAGAATALANVLVVVLAWGYFRRCQHPVLATTDKSLEVSIWRRLLAIGAPSGGEFALMFAFTALVYWLIRDSGTEHQAAFGIGMRIAQAVTMPAVALAFALPAVAGQNLGAGNWQRAQQSFWFTAQLTSVLMLVCGGLVYWQAAALMSLFTENVQVVAAGVLYLQITAINYVSAGLVLVCSGMFQAHGNTLPALAAALLRMTLFSLGAWYCLHSANFVVQQLWWCAVLAVFAQLLLISGLLWRQSAKKRLTLTNPAAAVGA